MRKLFFLFVFIFLINKTTFSQFLIQASTPVDVCYPSSVTLSVVSPQAGYTYNWFLGGYGCPGTGSSVPYNMGTSIQALITGEFYCLGMPPGGGNPQISNPVTVRVLPGMPASLLMPAPGLYTGSSSCVASASLCIPAIYYQNWPGTIIRWYKNNVLISGASSGSYTANSEGYYKYTITSGCMTALSDSTTVTMLPVATVAAGGSTTFCTGGAVTLNANAGISYSYQWKKDLVDISGATSSSYQANASGSYSVVITNSCGTAASGSIAVTVNPLPSASISATGSTTFCAGGSVVLNAPAGASLSYQWKKGANLISGATLSSYTATTGGKYKVIVTNTVTGCSKTTATATVVTVNALPPVTLTPQGPLSFCAGGSVVLQANTGAGLTYRWKKGGNYITFATASSYTATVGGTYKVQVTNSNGCSKTSAGVAVTVPCREGDAVNKDNFNAEVQPNPSPDIFVLKFLNVTEERNSIRVFDISGKLIFNTETTRPEFTLPSAQWSAGIYSALIENGRDVKMLKLIKAE